MLHYRATLLVADGNHDEAVRTALVIFRLASHFDHNPCILSYLVAIAVRGTAIDVANEALQAGPISKEVHDALDAELAVQQPMKGYAWALKSERLCVLEHFRDFIFSFWLFRGNWYAEKSACLELFPPLIARG